MLGDVELAQRHWKAAAAPLPAVGAHSYFQALAQRKLDDDEAARAILSRLAQFAERLAETDPKIDYFATSLPNLLLFDDDLVKRNRVDALFLNALVNHGLGDAEKAAQQLEQLLAEDPNHLLAAELLRWLKLQRPVAQEMRVERTEP
jgi:tetratricopeptide (TPR) repeat protein